MTFSGDTVGDDRIVGYRSYTSHSSSKRGDSRRDGEIHGSRSEDINHFSLFNFLESVDEVGISESRSWTSPYSFHHSGDHGISSGFKSYGDNISGHGYHTIQFYAYNHGGINIYHPRYSKGCAWRKYTSNHPLSFLSKHANTSSYKHAT